MFFGLERLRNEADVAEFLVEPGVSNKCENRSQEHLIQVVVLLLMMIFCV